MPISKARIGFKDFIILLDNEAIQRVLQKNNKNYKKSFAYKGLKEFLGEGLLTSEGENWLKNRRVLQPAFHKKEINKIESVIKYTVQDSMNSIPKGEVDLQKMFLVWTRDILLKSFFNLSPNEVDGMDNIHEHLWFLRCYANDRMKNPLMLPPSYPTKTNKKFKTSIIELESIIIKLFKQSAKKEEKGLFLQQILEQTKLNNWTDQQVFDEILTLFLAGQETTTNALVFLVHCLNQQPEYVYKVKDEKNPLQWEHIINEVLRLYPPAWAVSREAINEDVLLGEKIKTGTTMFLSIYAMHRLPELWNEPDKFYPERFLTDYPRQAFMPFGLGPRMCIGNHFSMLEMKIIADKIYSNFKVEVTNPEELKLVTPITMGPKFPLLTNFLPLH